ncbi:MAG: flagellar export chaperone FliS [Planctomycetota bacterium]
MTARQTSKTSSQAYLRTKVMTASPAELRLMLFDGALRFAEQARAGLDQRDYEQAYHGITRAQSIVMELINGLQPEQDPELCDRLASLYTFMYTRLMTASSERDPAIVTEVIDLLRFERETWSMLMARLATGEPATPAGPTGDGGGGGGGISVQG